jgi:hypothetical protein
MSRKTGERGAYSVHPDLSRTTSGGFSSIVKYRLQALRMIVQKSGSGFEVVVSWFSLARQK